MRTLAAVTVGALFSLLTSTASAIPLSGELKPPAGSPPDAFVSCASASAEVLRWSPAAGPLASYVTDAYLDKTDVFIALGYDSAGFWSAEGDPGNDGCDSCGRLFLRHTGFDGKQLSQHQIGQGLDNDPDRDDAKARRAAIKQKIFAVAKGPLDVAALRHDFTMSLPKHDADGHIDRFSGWFAEVKKKDGAVLRYAIVSSSFMCWCSSSWRAYTLAAPPKQ
jgi:hypothetical protein